LSSPKRPAQIASTGLTLKRAKQREGEQKGKGKGQWNLKMKNVCLSSVSGNTLLTAFLLYA
jgi:hypothetical protein